jgi:hypothetical protein
MRNMRSISIKIKGIVGALDTLLLLLLDIGFGELDEFLTFSVHPRVAFIIIFIANSILDMWPTCIQENTPCIFYFLILLILNLLFEGWEPIFGAIFPSQASSPHCYGYLKEVAL